MFFELWVAFVLSWFILFPAYAANGLPVLAKGRRPLDFGKTWKGKRILGDGKTIEGTAIGLIAGFLVGALEFYLLPDLQSYASGFGVVVPQITLLAAFMIAFGSIIGDLGGSFIKRKMGISRGGKAPFLDQLGFIILAVIFVYPFVKITVIMIMIMLVITFIVHRISNLLAHRMHLKNVPW